MGITLEDQQVRRLFSEVDTDGNGKVDFEEFLDLVRETERQEDSVSEVDGSEKSKEIFRVLDTDGDGSLSRDEWEQVVRRMGLHTTQEETMQLFALADTDRDGRIGVQEFVKYLGQ